MIRIHEITLDGFRGYRSKLTFEFPDRPNGSLLIYGPNGYGKSSITDAFEFLVNSEGTIERLGQRRVENMSGRAMLRHVGLDPEYKAEVSIAFSDNGTKYRETRVVSADGQPWPAPLRKIAQAQRIPYLVRGSELHKLVDEETPTDRYKEFARCLSAERLTTLQNDLRSVRTKLRNESQEIETKHNISGSTTRLTASALLEWDNAQALRWLNAKCSATPNTVPISVLSGADAGFLKLKQLQAEEASTARRGPLEQACAIVRELLPTPTTDRLRAPCKAVAEAQAKLVEIAKQTAQADHRPLVNAALVLLNEHTGLTNCPICGTPFESSHYGSRDAVMKHLRELDQSLGELGAADRTLAQAKRNLEIQKHDVESKIRASCGAAGVDPNALIALWGVAHTKLLDGKEEAVDALVEALRSYEKSLSQQIEKMDPDAPKVYEPLLTATAKLLVIHRQFSSWESGRRHRLAMLAEVEKVVLLVDRHINEFLHSAIDAVSSDTLAFYKRVQRVARVPVSIKVGLLDEENADARGVEVLVDMYDAKGLKPRAVLSDSERNTLALALRLALIRRFNRDLPFVVLDDVVTSYDAEHRRDIAIALADNVEDLQLVVLTHDNLFYRYLKTRIAEKDQARWNSVSILKYDPARGPFILGSIDSPNIDALLADGKPAGNEIRQYAEEWFHVMAQVLGAKFTMRKPEDPYNFTLRELVEGVLERAKAHGFDHAIRRHNLDGFIGEMRGGVFVNEGSHYQDNPHYVTGAPGTDESFWHDFTAFTELFKCARCGRRRFKYNPQTNRANCANAACNAALNFEPAPVDAH